MSSSVYCCLLIESTWGVLSKRKHCDYGRFFEENVRQDKDMDCMAVDVLMGALVFTRRLRRLHTARPAAHRREFYVRFVGPTLGFRLETARLEMLQSEKCSSNERIQMCIFHYSDFFEIWLLIIKLLGNAVINEIYMVFEEWSYLTNLLQFWEYITT